MNREWYEDEDDSYDYEEYEDNYYYEDDTDWEKESYLALGGDPDRYYDGALDDLQDAMGY